MTRSPMPMLAIAMMLFCVSAFLMDAIGIHAIFGGFLMGACMPRGLFVEELKRARDREQFDAFMAKRRNEGGSRSV